MLKLEDFKIKEIETLETITGGAGASIWSTRQYTNFMGWIIEGEPKGDSCRECDGVQ